MTNGSPVPRSLRREGHSSFHKSDASGKSFFSFSTTCRHLFVPTSLLEVVLQVEHGDVEWSAVGKASGQLITIGTTGCHERLDWWSKKPASLPVSISCMSIIYVTVTECCRERGKESLHLHSELHRSIRLKQ